MLFMPCEQNMQLSKIIIPSHTTTIYYVIMTNKIISIIVPCFNYAHFLAESIQSCLNQSYSAMEIIVINDGSTDDTSAIASQFPVKLIEQPNKGVASARNSGVAMAQGEWILPLDADDVLHPNMLEKMCAVEDDIIGVGQQQFGESNQVFASQSIHPNLDEIKAINSLNYCSLYRRSMWEVLGGYDNEVNGCEDWDFWIRAIKKGYTATVIPDLLFFYRIHKNSLSKGSKFAESYKKVKQTEGNH